VILPAIGRELPQIAWSHPRSRRAVRPDGGKPDLCAILDRRERLGQRAYLVDLDQDQLQIPFLMPSRRFRRHVGTKISSPNHWHLAPIRSVTVFQPSLPPRHPSSIETMGNVYEYLRDSLLSRFVEPSLAPRSGSRRPLKNSVAADQSASKLSFPGAKPACGSPSLRSRAGFGRGNVGGAKAPLIAPIN